MFKYLFLLNCFSISVLASSGFNTEVCSRPEIRRVLKPSQKQECERLDKQKENQPLPCSDTNNLTKCCANSPDECQAAGEKLLHQGAGKDAIKYLKPVCDDAVAAVSDACDLLAAAYFNSGDSDSAVKYAKEPCESYNRPTACKVMGFSYLNAGNYRSAEAIMGQMCNLNSEKEFCIGKAHAQYEQGNIGDALKGLQEYCTDEKDGACGKQGDAVTAIKSFCLPADFESSSLENGGSEWRCNLGDNKEKAVEWYSLDKKKAEGLYESSVKVGLWKYYDHAGKVTEETLQDRSKKNADAKKVAVLKEQQEKSAAIKKQKEQAAELFCKCQQYEASLIDMINREKNIGKTVGVVDKQKLHNLGSQLLMVQDLIKQLQKQPDASKQCSKKYPLQTQAECSVEAANKYYKDKTQ